MSNQKDFVFVIVFLNIILNATLITRIIFYTLAIAEVDDE